MNDQGIAVTSKQELDIEAEMKGRFFSVKQFMEAGGVTKSQLEAKGHRRLAPRDREDAQRIVASLKRMAQTRQMDIKETFFGKKPIDEPIEWKEVDNAIYYKFGHEGKAIMEDS